MNVNVRGALVTTRSDVQPIDVPFGVKDKTYKARIETMIAIEIYQGAVKPCFDRLKVSADPGVGWVVVLGSLAPPAQETIRSRGTNLALCIDSQHTLDLTADVK